MVASLPVADRSCFGDCYTPSVVDSLELLWFNITHIEFNCMPPYYCVELIEARRENTLKVVQEIIYDKEYGNVN